MDRFDFDDIPVPFRMQPGLARLAAGVPQLTALVPGSALFAEKHRVMSTGPSRLPVPGFDPAPALAAIAHQAVADGCDDALASGRPLELAFEEDFAVLEGETGTLPWLCVCVPSHWAPEDKLGRSFAEVHAPVADASAVVTASRQLVALATGGERWQRQVWTITPSPYYDHHPGRRARAPWPARDQDPEAFATACFLRVERQTFFPVGRGTRQAVFTIRVGLHALADAIDTPWKAARLHDSLASMSPAVLDYKGLAAAREPLLRWLATRSGRQEI